MKKIYFAYGSNMSSQRMCERIPGAKSVGTAYLMNKMVVFNKKGSDGSGKANLIDKPEHEIWGVWGALYEIDSADFKKLDGIEGGYSRVCLTAYKNKNKKITVETYMSDKTADNLEVDDSYKQKLIDGAVEHELPEDYIEYLR